jgi:hypothetical protein
VWATETGTPYPDFLFPRQWLPPHWTFLADSSTGNCVTRRPFPSHRPQNHLPDCEISALDRIVHDSLRLALKGESMRKLTSKLEKYSEETDELSPMNP